MGDFNHKGDETKIHVAVLTFPFGTHAAPLLNLTLRLAEVAPYATFSFFSTPKSNGSIFSSSSSYGVHNNIKRYDVYDGVPEGYVFTGKKQEDIELFLSATPDNFSKELDKVVSETGKKITCFLTDAFIWHAADMAQKMNVPWIPFWTAATGSLSTHFYTDLIRDQYSAAGGGGGDDMPLNFIPGIPSNLQFKDLPREVGSGNLDSVFSRLLHKMGQTVQRGAAVALNSFEELDPSIIKDFNSKFHRCLAVGPIAPLTSPSSVCSNQDPKGCIPWLDTQKMSSVAYISFGTITTPPPQELIALAEALEESGVAFLWSLKDHIKSQLPSGFLDRTSHRGLVLPWAPQPKVLQHASLGVFVTHCGWNSVIESITGGVPMICRPFFGDQPFNGQLVSKVWGIGVGAKNGILSKDGLIEAFDLILSKDEGKKMRERVVVLKALAKQAVEVEPQGSSTKNFNTLVDMVITTNSVKEC